MKLKDYFNIFLKVQLNIDQVQIMLRIVILGLTCFQFNMAHSQTLKLVSWNIYFDNISGETRYPKIIRSLVNQKPNIACLQEVTDKFIELVKKDPRLKTYHLTYNPLLNGYSNIILSNIPAIGSGTFSLPSKMSRKATYLRLNKTLAIVNLHLESPLDSQSIRKQQLSKVSFKFGSYRDVVLCGDFNYGDGENDDFQIRLKYRDVAEKNLQYTYDVSNNRLARLNKYPKEKSRRLDRIYIKGLLSVSKYKVYRNSLSDHYMISAEIRLKSK